MSMPAAATVMRIGVACLALSISLAGCAGSRASARVERADIAIAVIPDGSLDVREQFAVRAEDTPVVFERTVTHPHMDAVTFLGASLNGTAEPRRETGAFSVRDGRALRVRWTLPAGPAGARHAVELRYRAVGVVFVGEGQGRLDWPALPARRSFSIDAARLELHLPKTPVRSETIGVVEAGWEVSRAPWGLLATRAQVGREAAVIVAELGIDRTIIAVPSWQVSEDLRRQFAPAFISGALFMLVIGGGVIWMLRFKHRAAGVSVTASTDERQRSAAASGLRKSAVAVGLLAAACMGLAAAFLPRFGWWGQLLPASMMFIALLFRMSAGHFSRRRQT